MARSAREGAALLAPILAMRPDTSGYLTRKPEDLRPMFEEALRRGIQSRHTRSAIARTD